MARRFFLQNAATVGAVAAFPAIVPARVLGKDAPSNTVNVAQIGCGRIGITMDVPGFLRATGARLAAAAPPPLRATYAAGINMGIGHEPNGGVTTIDIPRAPLSEGERIVFSATPLSSLGTRGTPITLSKKRHRKDETKS